MSAKNFELHKKIKSNFTSRFSFTKQNKRGRWGASRLGWAMYVAALVVARAATVSLSRNAAGLAGGMWMFLVNRRRAPATLGHGEVRGSVCPGLTRDRGRKSPSHDVRNQPLGHSLCHSIVATLATARASHFGDVHNHSTPSPHASSLVMASLNPFGFRDVTASFHQSRRLVCCVDVHSHVLLRKRGGLLGKSIGPRIPWQSTVRRPPLQHDLPATVH